MAENHIGIRVNGVSLQYPNVTTKDDWPEVLLEDVLDADVIDG